MEIPRIPEIQNALRSCGLGRRISIVLAVLIVEGPSTSMQVQMAAMVPRSAVGHGAKEGIEKGWISEASAGGTGGRPVKEYRLAIPVEEIFANIENTQPPQNARTLRNVNRLREMVTV